MRKNKGWDKCITISSGCTKVSPACLHCWAETNHNRFMRKANKKYDHDFSEVRVHPENISILNRTKKPRIFSVWNDAFIKQVPDSVLDLLFETINRNCQHTYLICTKRPEYMAEYFNKEENYKFLAHTHKIFLGTTVENQEMANQRIPELLKCKPFGLFLSVEPMLSPIDYSDIICRYFDAENIHCIIVGSESSRNPRPTQEEWVRDLREQCLNAGVPLWIKQLKIDGKMVYDHPLSTVTRENLWR